MRDPASVSPVVVAVVVAGLVDTEVALVTAVVGVTVD